MILVRKELIDNGTVKGIADLKGRKFGNISPGATGEHLIHKLMQKAGLGMGDVEQIYMPPPQLNTAFQNKVIDASLMTEPFTTLLTRRGMAHILVPCKDVYPGMQVAAIFYGKAMIERPEVAQKFMNAYILGSRIYNDALVGGKIGGPKGEEIIKILSKWTEQKDLQLLRDVAPHGLNPDGRLIMESVVDDFAFFKGRKLIEGNVTVEAVVDNGYAERAVKALGPYKPQGG
jgi:NitT/TauT family transport system substrate-binding protein